MEDIDKGIRCAAKSCPIALAMSRTTGEPWSVDYSRMWSEDHYPRGLKIGRRLQAFMRDFDNQSGVAPATFRVRL